MPNVEKDHEEDIDDKLEWKAEAILRARGWQWFWYGFFVCLGLFMIVRFVYLIIN